MSYSSCQNIFSSYRSFDSSSSFSQNPCQSRQLLIKNQNNKAVPEKEVNQKGLQFQTNLGCNSSGEFNNDEYTLFPQKRQTLFEKEAPADINKQNRDGTNISLYQRDSCAETNIKHQKSIFQEKKKTSLLKSEHTFNHESKFFIINQNKSISNQQPQNLRKRKVGITTGLAGYSSPQKIPLIQEWFTSLTVEERVLSLTCIDHFVTHPIMQMKKKLSKNGQGKFQFTPYLKQDYKFVSNRALTEQLKEDLEQSTKCIHEKELMDYILLTDSFEKNDTLTVSCSLVADPNKFFELLSKIAGSNFLKIPYEIIWDQERKYFITKDPMWFYPYSHNSLATWIAYFLERTMWIQFFANVKGEFQNAKDRQNNAIFIAKENKLINLKNELLSYWKDFQEKLKSDQNLKLDIEQQLFNKRRPVMKQGNDIPTNNYIQENLSFKQDIEFLIQLCINQDPTIFLNNLGKINLENIERENYNSLQRLLIEILKERSVKDIQSQFITQNKKLQKKKIKKKIKQQSLKEQLKQDQIVNQHLQQPCISKQEEEVKSNLMQQQQKQEEEKEIQPKKKQSLADLILEQLMKKEQLETDSEQYSSSEDEKIKDFCSNIDYISKQNISSVIPQASKRDGYSELLQELLSDSPRKVEKKVIQLQKSQPIQERVCYNPLTRDIQKQIIELIEVQQKILKEEMEFEKIDSSEQLLKEEISATSESTDDIQDNANSLKSLNQNIQKQCQEHNSKTDSENEQLFKGSDQKQHYQESPNKIFKKKQQQHSNQQIKDKQELEYEESKTVEDDFLIIRSNRSFNPQQDINNNTKSNHSQFLNKKKKKKKSKAVGTNNQCNDQQSSKLNSFIRNMIKQQEDLENEKEEIKEIKEIPKIQQNQNEYTKRNEPKVKVSTQKMYVKKQKQQTSPSEEIKKKDEQPYLFNKSLQNTDKQKVEQQTSSKRFDNFINQKETVNTSKSYDKQFLDKPKKNKSKNNKKSSWGNTKKKSSNTPNQKNIEQMNNMPITRQINNTIDNFQKQFELNNPKQYNNYQQMNNSYYTYNIQELLTSAAAELIQQQSYNSQLYVYDNHSIENSQLQDLETHILIDDKIEQFFDIMEQQMILLTKDVQKKLDSVRKEREGAINIIEEIVNRTYNEYNSYNNQQHNSSFVGIRMYGSMASGLAIDSSDVDLSVIGLNFNGNRELLINEMRSLYEKLEFLTSRSSIKFIDTATVPIIKLQIDLQKVNQKLVKYGNNMNQVNEIDQVMRYLGIDITFQDSSAQQMVDIMTPEGPAQVNLGIQCISYIQSLCMRFSDLKPIVIVLKKLLQNNNLNQPYLGGLSSYSIVLMTSTFLNTCNAHSMGKNLTEFLNYYGNYFDPLRTGLNGDIYYSLLGTSNDPIVVIDPLNSLNNTTRTTFRIQEILDLFKKAHSVIMKKMEEFKENDIKDINVVDLLIKQHDQ